MPDELLAIFGPTGAGKTQIAIELSDLLREQGERPIAISADAIQVYRGLDVLSGKATEQQQARLEHRLLSYVPLDEEYSAGEYATVAHAEIDAALERNRLPIVVGGTGLYLRAGLTDLDLKPPAEPDLRAEIEAELEDGGPGALHEQLSATTAAGVHPNDGKRIVRALELERMGERPHATSQQLWSEELRLPTRLLGVVVEREELAERVSTRVDEMLHQGAIEEVESAIDLGISRTAAKALGFREIANFAAGGLERDELAEKIKRRHVTFAKRQMTWMRKLPNVELIDRTGIDDQTAARLLADAVS